MREGYWIQGSGDCRLVVAGCDNPLVPRFPFFVSGVLVATSGLAVARLLIAPAPWAPAAAALLAGTGIGLTVIAVAGVLLAKGRWARALGAGLALLWLGVGAAPDPDPLGTVMLAAGGVALICFVGPWLSRGWLRRLPSAGGPPPVAVAVVLGLLGIPVLVALARPSGPEPAGWALALAAAVLAWGLARALTPALWGVRLGLPVLGAVAAAAAGLPAGLWLGIGTVLVAALSWHPAVPPALRPPLTTRARGIPIPPELAPAAVLEAAGVDDRGHRKEASR